MATSTLLAPGITVSAVNHIDLLLIRSSSRSFPAQFTNCIIRHLIYALWAVCLSTKLEFNDVTRDVPADCILDQCVLLEFYHPQGGCLDSMGRARIAWISISSFVHLLLPDTVTYGLSAIRDVHERRPKKHGGQYGFFFFFFIKA